MKESHATQTDRRRFLASAAGAASALSIASAPRVFAQVSGVDEIRIALVGCGGRGTGAAVNALVVNNARTKLVAMADVFEHRLADSFMVLSDKFSADPDKMAVPPDQRFVGFDAYKQAMDVLRPGDLVIMATPPAFRWVHFQYAIDRGLHVFMEKPVTVDGPTSKRMFGLAKKADEKNLKCAVGLMVRHCRGRQELHKRIQDGAIGDIVMMRAYRMHGPLVTCFSPPKPADRKEVLWQVERFHSFLWASGGLFSDFYIHQIDETSWMKNAWPVKAQALGGRHYRGDYVDQNFDTYAVEYTYPDGSKLFFDGRTMNGCYSSVSSVAHGSKGSAYVSATGHSPSDVRIFSGQHQKRSDIVWAYPNPDLNLYKLEWVDLIDAIVNDKPYNEVPRGVEASLVTSMGRMAAHTGRQITYEEMLNCPHEFAPGVADLTPDGPAPIMPDDQGRYPVPMPGVVKNREYGNE